MEKKKLLLIFIHGFRGSDTSFKDFPNWLQTSLHNSLHTNIETIVYPKYKTTGDLSFAVSNFSTWLLEQVKRNDYQVDIVLLGHSMGGIVAAETILLFQAKRDHNPLKQASIIGLLAYDTPFYSVNQESLSTTVFSQVEKLGRFIPSAFTDTTSAGTRSTVTTTTTRTGPSSSDPLSLTWPQKASTSTKPSSRSKTTTTTTTAQTSSSTATKWGLFAGAVGAVGVAAVGAYLSRDKITSTFSDAYDHLEFVSALMDQQGCQKRMKALVNVPDILVRCFYIKIPSVDKQQDKTFIALPPADMTNLFLPMVTTAESEIDAHTSIFDPRKNDCYYTVGSDSISLIIEMIRLRYSPNSHTSTTLFDASDLD